MPAISLRDERDADEAFLRGLYRAVRWKETAMLGLDAVRTAFLDQQFALQRHHYRSYYPDARFAIVEEGGVAIGRLCVWRDERHDMLVDIALQPESTGKGIGAGLIAQVQADAAANGRGVSLHVDVFNPARRLYERLGFRIVEQVGPDWRMEWSPEGATTVIEASAAG